MDPSLVKFADADKTRAPLLIGGVTPLLCIATFMVSLRVWCRFQIKEFGLDDAAAVVTWFLIMVCGCVIMIVTRDGFGKHVWTLSDEQIVVALRGFWLSNIFHTLSLLTVKLAFLFHYYRLFSVSSMKPVLIASITVVLIWAAIQGILGIVQCIPIQGVWDHKVKAKCLPHVVTWWYFNGAFNIVSDVVILIIPLPVLWKLKLQRSQKLLLMGIFGLGFLTVAISILRLQWLIPNMDVTWWATKTMVWSVAEVTSAITCACLPTFRPLIVAIQRFIHGDPGGSDSVVNLHAQARAPDIESDLTEVEMRERLSGSTKYSGSRGSFEVRTCVTAERS